MLRRHAVIRCEHAHAVADLIVQSGKHAVCIAHCPDISTAVQLQNDFVAVRILLRL